MNIIQRVAKHRGRDESEHEIIQYAYIATWGHPIDRETTAKLEAQFRAYDKRGTIEQYVELWCQAHLPADELVEA